MLMYFSSRHVGQPQDGAPRFRATRIAHLVTAKHWHNVKPDGLHFTIADTGWGKAVWGKYYGQWLMEARSAHLRLRPLPSRRDTLARRSSYGITTLCCPPTMYRLMTEPRTWTPTTCTRSEYSTTAGEALNPDLFDFWQRAHRPHHLRGLRRRPRPRSPSRNLTNSTPRPGSMGKPVPLYDVEIQREDGSRLRHGRDGRGVHRHRTRRPAGIMLEYYRDPEKTAAAVHDGWYHTGDTAWRDEEGNYWYVGRNDDVIKSSGYRIGPFEIEIGACSSTTPCARCAVTGVPDPVRGFAVKATVVLADGCAGKRRAHAPSCRSWVKTRTAPYKYPRIIEYVDELPTHRRTARSAAPSSARRTRPTTPPEDPRGIRLMTAPAWAPVPVGAGPRDHRALRGGQDQPRAQPGARCGGARAGALRWSTWTW